VTTTWINVLTPEQKEEQRKELEKQVEEYLAKGGKITKCPPNAFTETDVEGKPKAQVFCTYHTRFPDRLN
jgi:glutathione peroxidase-family protein